ncbi:MAG: hypothetical protein IJU64_00430 [Bacilli bacterium]|nr:hypothetical protein [Bacilli bacterium]
MIEFDLSLEILTEVMEKKVPFADALKNKFFSNPALRPHRNVVAGLVGCEIRHHILFEYLLKDIEGLTEEEKRYVELALANDYFFHRFAREEIDTIVAEKLGAEKMEKIQPLLDNSANPEEFVPLSVKRNSQLYFSLRYNIPDWALRIFRHYPHYPILKTLKKFGRPAANCVRVRDVVKAEELIATGEFSTSNTEGILNYVGKVALRKNEAYRQGKLFSEKELTKILIDTHHVSEPGEILLYNGNHDSSLEKELIENYGSSIGLNIAVPQTDDRPDVVKLIKEKELKNVNFFSAPDPMAMEAAISRQQDLVIAAPNSTNFDLVPTAPDYLLNFNRDAMDALFAQEKAVLEGASKYVEVGGKLLYVIYTISMKEGAQTVAAFLKEHPEFEMVEDRQHFPFESHQTAAYVAVMVKKENELTVAPPLNELSSLQPSASAGATASAE